MKPRRLLVRLTCALACVFSAVPGAFAAGLPFAIVITVPAASVSTSSPVKASFYSEECRGLPMADGRPFNPDVLTCASWDYPLGTVLEVTSGGRSVQVTVTDRGPAKRLVAKGVVIDLTRAAFERLGDLAQGHLPVEIRRMN